MKEQQALWSAKVTEWAVTEPPPDSPSWAHDVPDEEAKAQAADATYPGMSAELAN